MRESRPFFHDGWPVLPNDDSRKYRRVEREFYDGAETLALECTQLGCKPSRQTKIVNEWCEFFRAPNPVRRLALTTRTPIKLFEAVCMHTELEQLSISWGPIKSLSPLARLTKLTHLSIGCSGVESLSPLSALKELRELSVARLFKVSDYSVLGELPSLELVSIDGDPLAQRKKASIDSLAFVSELPHLRGLNIGYCKVLADEWHKPLIGHPRLEELYLPPLDESNKQELLGSLSKLRQHNFLA